jgi:transposase
LDEYVDAENPVRFIDAFVDGLDLAAAGFIRVKPKTTGRPGYAPKDLLKLYIYGYLNRIRSSRRLEAETHRNIEVIWLLRHLKPDFKTIADFRRINHKAFRLVFRQFVLLCRQLDLFGRARSACRARPGRFAQSLVSRTKRCWIGWRLAW